MIARGTTSAGDRGAASNGTKFRAAGGAEVSKTRRKASPSAARGGQSKRKRAIAPSFKRKTNAAAGASGKRVAKGAANRSLKRVVKGSPKPSLKRVARVSGGRGAVGGRWTQKPVSPASNRRSSVGGNSGSARAEKRKSGRAPAAKGSAAKTKIDKGRSVKTRASKGKLVKAQGSERRTAKSSPGTVGEKGKQNRSRAGRRAGSTSQRVGSKTRKNPSKAGRTVPQNRTGHSKTASRGGKGRKSSALATGLLTSCFAGLRRQRPPDGLGVVVALVETVGGQIDATVIACDRLGNLGPRGGARVKPSVAPARLGGSGPKSTRHLSLALAAMGHPVRIKILTMLLDGPGVYRSLQKVTGLKPGPLYHHVNQLRLAGLIGPKERDLYELTRAGRNLLMVTLALEPLLKDRRLRPQATG